MKKTTPLAYTMVLLSIVGCSQMPNRIETVSQEQIDKEPLIVGMPFAERVEKTSKTIEGQLDLLNKIKRQEQVGAFEMVKHNNDLDARLYSDKTIPKAYNTIKVKEQVSETTKEIKEVKEVKEVKENLFDKKLKVVDWENNSFKELIKMFSSSIGYEFIDNENIKDFNVTLKVSNIKISDALIELQKKSEKVNIVLKEKTITITSK